MTERHSRARGMLVGMAVGDALGAPVEFDSPAAIAGRREELFRFPGGGAFGWAPGEFTDDTQMAIVLARRLIEDGPALDQQALAEGFADWARDAADVGNQTRSVLSRVARGDSWQDAISHMAPAAEGNGSLMRAAPAVLAGRDRDEALRLVAEQSEVTHPAEVCLDACRVFAWTSWELLDGALPTLSQIAETATTSTVRDAVLSADASGEMSGWVVDTLRGALWAVLGAESFADAIWRAVALGRDADTVGAVAGALAGARWGLEAIPRDAADRPCSRHPAFGGDYPSALVDLADALT